MSKNRLAREQSPYLLQHADNPVDWHPWGEEAFQKALRENKPVFLSIGYSTCHWCHVMEHESFSDQEVGRVLNKSFISVKVDREERPDIDQYYMNVCAHMSNNCGWPLTVLLTPDRKAFFVTTYLPKNTRFGRLGLLELLEQVRKMWKSERTKIDDMAARILVAVKESDANRGGEKNINRETLEAGYRQLTAEYDPLFAGFGGPPAYAPKFPIPHKFRYLLRYWDRTGTKTALEMAEKSLLAMSRGGLYDHIGRGFHRYATDRKWAVPHFEKMLYDQALLAIAYAELYQAGRDPRFARVARETLQYVERDMTSKEGGFYSAEDADSEGKEGYFYLWREKGIRSLLGEEKAKIFFAAFSLETTPELQMHYKGDESDLQVLVRKKSTEEVARELKLSIAKASRELEASRLLLYRAREKRKKPFKDDKILTDWNGLMISALAINAQALGRPKYAARAKKAADFILANLRDKNGELLHRYRRGKAGIPGLLDDYAYFIQGLLDLYETVFDLRYLQAALELNEIQIRKFWDDKKGGFYFTSAAAGSVASLPGRRKEVYDGALPSGNSVAASNLLRLARITAKTELEEKASKIGKYFYRIIQRSPANYSRMLMANDFAIGGSLEIVIAGEVNSPEVNAMLAVIQGMYLPRKVIVLRDKKAAVSKLAPYTKDQDGVEGKATVYICRNYQCNFPLTDPEKVRETLKKEKNAKSKAESKAPSKER